MRPDVEEFFCGISFDAYRLLGSHPAGPGRGWLFTLWAPHARRVQLLGDWNGWDLYSAAELTFCEEGCSVRHCRQRPHPLCAGCDGVCPQPWRSGHQCNLLPRQ